MADHIGTRLRAVRGNWTQQEFASRMGTDKNTIGRYERGERVPDAVFLARLRKVSGVSLDWLICGAAGAGTARPPFADIDPELLAAIAEGVATVLHDQGADFAAAELGRVCARILNQLLIAYETGSDRLVGLRLALAQLRSDPGGWL